MCNPWTRSGTAAILDSTLDLRPFRISDFCGKSFHKTSDILEPYAIKINSVADSSRSNATFTVLI